MRSCQPHQKLLTLSPRGPEGPSSPGGPRSPCDTTKPIKTYQYYEAKLCTCYIFCAVTFRSKKIHSKCLVGFQYCLIELLQTVQVHVSEVDQLPQVQNPCRAAKPASGEAIAPERKKDHQIRQ